MLGNSNDERIIKLIELATGIKVPSEEEQEMKELTYRYIQKFSNRKRNRFRRSKKQNLKLIH